MTATILATLTLLGRQVATYDSGDGIDGHLAPRPFLHPVTTLAGTTVTDCRPDDHHWHLGVSVAVQDVAGSNLWGGRTYVRDHGYQWREDHGVMRHRDWIERAADRLEHRLAWIAHDGTALVHETRALHATALPGVRAWTLHWSSALHAAGSSAIDLGSPGTNGRVNAGYGGFFWRLPRPAGAVDVLTPDASGEQAVHGRPAAWLAFASAAHDARHPYTLIFQPGDERTAADPWFVRVEGYPGIGSALAFDEVLRLEPGTPVRLRMRVHVIDGRLGRTEVQALHDTISGAHHAPHTPTGDGRDLDS
jgi:hypothetical protein